MRIVSDSQWNEAYRAEQEVAHLKNTLFLKEQELDSLFTEIKYHSEWDYTKVVGDAYERTFTTGGCKDPDKANKLRKEIENLKVQIAKAERKSSELNGAIRNNSNFIHESADLASKFSKMHRQLPIWKKLIWKLGKEKKYLENMSKIHNAENTNDMYSAEYQLNKLFNGGKKKR